MPCWTDFPAKAKKVWQVCLLGQCCKLCSPRRFLHILQGVALLSAKNDLRQWRLLADLPSCRRIPSESIGISNDTRFVLELEFVQALASPGYLQCEDLWDQ